MNGKPGDNPITDFTRILRSVAGESLVGSRFGATVFLGAHHEEEDHELVFFDNPEAAHTAFRVASLADLQTFYRQVKGQGVSIKAALNHGSSLAFYFDDPKGM